MVLDTNVVSELMRPEPHPAVLSWVGRLPPGALHTTSVTQAEILYGIALLPAGKRRDALATAADAVFTEDFAGRVLPFDGAAAERSAAIVAARRQAGNPIENFDAQIAAIALAAGAAVATRDIGGFAGCGLAVVDPWRAA
jgi:toxin FitB